MALRFGAILLLPINFWGFFVTDKPKKRGPGNPNMIKGAPSVNPRGRAASRDYLNRDIDHALREALNNEAHGGAVGYMQKLAAEKPALFCGLLQKVMPSDIAATVQHTIIDLGAAMAEAEARLARMQPVLEITPLHVQPLDDQIANEHRLTLQPVDNKEKV